MFQTKLGQRNLNRRYTLSELSSTFTNPTLGQVVVLNSPLLINIAPLKPIAASKGRRSAASGAHSRTGMDVSPPMDLGKLQLASANGLTSNGDLDGVIVQIIKTPGGALDSIVVAPPGEVVPLYLFGTLATLKGLGDSNILFVSTDTAGAVQSQAPIPGNYARRVARIPKFFSNLVAADLDPDSATSIYVQVIEERPLPT